MLFMFMFFSIHLRKKKRSLQFLNIIYKIEV